MPEQNQLEYEPLLPRQGVGGRRWFLRICLLLIATILMMLGAGLGLGALVAMAHRQIVLGFVLVAGSVGAIGLFGRVLIDIYLDW